MVCTALSQPENSKPRGEIKEGKDAEKVRQRQKPDRSVTENYRHSVTLVLPLITVTKA